VSLDPRSYVISNLSTNNLGNYSVVITDSSGSVTSSVATLNMPAYIQQPPSNANVWIGNSATFNVTAGGVGPFSYQWAVNGTNIVGATNASYGIASVAVTNGGVYTVGVTNAYGGDRSAGATLTVDYITQQPTNVVVTNGGLATFSVSVSGLGPFTYQWRLNGTNLPPVLNAFNGIITTVAGNGSTGFSGDGGVATNAAMNKPYGVAVDSAGNWFFADYNNHRVRKVDTNGLITTVAGNGTASFSGDGGAATSATLSYPYGVAVDSAGNLFIADQNNSRIRRVGTNGIITTVAGGGNQGDGSAGTNVSLIPFGVAVDGAGNVFIADFQTQRIRKLGTNGIVTSVAGNGSPSYSGDGGAATNAALYNPFGMAVDSGGNIFIGDAQNVRVRKVGTNGIITTVAGNGSSGTSSDGGLATNMALVYPTGVVPDSFGNVFFTDGNRIRKVDANGIITTVAGTGVSGYTGDGGLATSATLQFIYGLALDTNGNLLISDYISQRLRKVSLDPRSYVISNLSTNNLGNYSVVITAPAGTFTSAVASLSLLLAPQNFAAYKSVNGLQIQLVGTPGYFYVLQSATNLTPVINWQPVITNPADGNGNWSFTVTNLTGPPARFYRAFRQ
jgi:hypothetical protein